MAITAIRSRVDRRTYARYQQAWSQIATRRSIPVVTVGAVPAPVPPASLGVSGADLLPQLGARAQTSIAEMIRRSYSPSLKYGTALATGPDLRLADEHEVLDSHKKTVMSDELSGAWVGLSALRLVVGFSLRRESHANGSRVYIGDPDEATTLAQVRDPAGKLITFVSLPKRPFPPA